MKIVAARSIVQGDGHDAAYRREAASFNQSAAANPDRIGTLRSRVAGIRERTVRSTAAPEAVAELGRWAEILNAGVNHEQ